MTLLVVKLDKLLHVFALSLRLLHIVINRFAYCTFQTTMRRISDFAPHFKGVIQQIAIHPVIIFKHYNSIITTNKTFSRTSGIIVIVLIIFCLEFCG